MVVIQSATNFKKSSVVMPVMGDRDDFEKTGFAKRRQRLDIAVDHRLKRPPARAVPTATREKNGLVHAEGRPLEDRGRLLC
jgi:hypothetical protein